MTAAIPARPGRATIQASDVSLIRIGPDVLELVSTAMYVDPRTLLREYLQNAADSIDAAREQGMLARDEGMVRIAVDRDTRSLRIRDNGTGLSPERFYGTLTALGGSSKRGTRARGFRGVGRLAGLGYARELVFRSRTDRGSISELVWDCRLLRTLLRNASTEDDLPSVIANSTRFATVEADDEVPERFFDVELRGVARLRNDVLLNEDLIKAYIAEVCPVPFDAEFAAKEQLETYLNRYVATTSLAVHFDDNVGITRPHRDRMMLEDGRALALESVEMFELPDRNGGIGAVGWLAHHAYDGAVPGPMGIKGIRLRQGNVQVGGHVLLEDLFKEVRFNSWVVGEIHVIDPQVIPNARRDHFEQNAAWNHLANQFLPMARDLSDRCRTTSIRRNVEKRFGAAFQSAEMELVRLESGTLSRSMAETASAKARSAIEDCSRLLQSRFLSETTRKEAEGALEGLRPRLEECPRAPEGNGERIQLAGLPEGERAVYNRVLDAVLESATTIEDGRRIVDAVLARLMDEAKTP